MPGNVRQVRQVPLRPRSDADVHWDGTEIGTAARNFGPPT